MEQLATSSGKFPFSQARNQFLHHNAAEGPTGFKGVIDSLAEHYRSTPIDLVLGIEARGFIIARLLMHSDTVYTGPQGKKLPRRARRIQYALEYGTDVLEIHKDAITAGQNVLIIDDVLATGGTAAAVARLVRPLHGKVAKPGFSSWNWTF